MVIIQLRRGVASRWTTANPTLAEGELGIETDTLKFKLGDGTTPWNSLGYGGPRGIFPIAAEVEIEWDENYPSNFSQLSYDSVTGRINGLDVYDSSAKAIHIFSKTFAYDSVTGKLSGVLITHFPTGAMMTKSISYNGNGKVASVTRAYTA